MALHTPGRRGATSHVGAAVRRSTRSAVNERHDAAPGYTDQPRRARKPRNSQGKGREKGPKFGVKLPLRPSSRLDPVVGAQLADCRQIMDEKLDTSAQRPPTGLNRGAREMILEIIQEVHAVGVQGIVEALFTKRYSSRQDYYEALEQVWGEDIRAACTREVNEAESRAGVEANSTGLLRRVFGSRPHRAGAWALLISMPESDFRLAVESVVIAQKFKRGRAARRITEVCERRGSPWVFRKKEGFVWVGERLVEEQLLRPAATILADPRFAGGVKMEFEAARNELGVGTPTARKQAVHEAANSVESALKVLLTLHGIQYEDRDGAQRLFERLVAAAVVPQHMERLVLAAAQSRNKTGGHGAGAVAHDVSVEQAEAVVAAAAGAITFLGRLFPP